MMVKILYSVNGDGLGHAARSVPIIKALSKKHRVKVIVSSKRAGEFMQKHLDDVKAYEGIRFVYEKNKLDVYQTFMRNAKIILRPKSTFRNIYRSIKGYKPNIIITDCDFPTITVARLFKTPLLCVCNIHALSEMKYNLPKEYRKIGYAQKMTVKALSTRVDHHVITSFFYLPVKNKNVSVFPPILRKEIYETKPKRKEYYLVYQTSVTNKNLIKTLHETDARFIVYGFDKDLNDGNVTFRKTNNDRFFKDLKDCKGCIANGGFTFISEAVSLHKPVLSIPIQGTIEQVLNAVQIKRLGYGDMCKRIDRKTLARFMANNGKFYNNLRRYKKSTNEKVIKKIEDLIDS